jgi:hypothetical protein
MENRKKLNAQRTIDYKNGTYAHEGGVYQWCGSAPKELQNPC